MENAVDDFGHGTHVAADAAGYRGLAPGADGVPGTADDVPVHGVAPQAQLMGYKVCSGIGSATATVGCLGTSIILAIEDAVSPRTLTGFAKPVADVINLSLGSAGGPDDSDSVAADNAALLGTVVVAAAGNDGPGAAHARLARRRPSRHRRRRRQRPRRLPQPARGARRARSGRGPRQHGDLGAGLQPAQQHHGAARTAATSTPASPTLPTRCRRPCSATSASSSAAAPPPPATRAPACSPSRCSTARPRAPSPPWCSTTSPARSRACWRRAASRCSRCRSENGPLPARHRRLRRHRPLAAQHPHQPARRLDVPAADGGLLLARPGARTGPGQARRRGARRRRAGGDEAGGRAGAVDGEPDALHRRQRHQLLLAARRRRGGAAAAGAHRVGAST